MKVRELWHTTKEKTVIQIADCEFTNSSQILIQTMYSLVSMGTERLVSRGMVPAELWDSMMVPHMSGSFSFPVKYGYSLVGKVVGGPDEWLNKHVHLMNPHQDFVVVSPEDVSVIPEEVGPQRAVLVGLMETACNAVWDSGISVGDTVLVSGFGIVGALIASVASKIPGVQLYVNEPNELRRQLAQSMGFVLFQETSGVKVDIAFNASAKGAGLQFCINKTGSEGTIVEVSWYGTETVELNLGAGFHIGRQRIISSQVSQVPGAKGPRWTKKRRKDVVFELLKDPVYDRLLTCRVPFSDAPAAFDAIRKGNPDDICITFTY
jgi:2-desacetyl-2-hydroxyethyl bacteriochlorophyllide A dehydrogenase